MGTLLIILWYSLWYGVIVHWVVVLIVYLVGDTAIALTTAVVKLRTLNFCKKKLDGGGSNRKAGTFF